jgi:sugar phosphate isomerase/epimerase
MNQRHFRNVRLACSEFSFLSLSHELALDLVAGLGFEGVDISLMLGYAHLPVPEVFENPQEWGRRMLSMTTNRGLAAADVNFLPGGDFEKLAVNHPGPGDRTRAAELFRRALEFASAAGSRHMTMLPGIFWPAEEPEDSFGRSAEELSWRVAEAAAQGVQLSIEAHVGSITPSPAAALRLVRAVPSLTLTLDLTHFICQGYKQEECMPLLDVSSHFHGRGAALDRLQVPAEDNTIDYELVLDAMRVGGYPGYFEVEFEWNEWGGCNRVDVLAETILMRDLVLRRQ